MPATMSSCLNSCGLCGRAYQEPGREPGRHEEVARTLGGRAGQRGRLDLDEVAGAQHRAGGGVDLGAQPDRAHPPTRRRGGAGRGSGACRRASSPTVTRSSIWKGSGAEALSTSISRRDDLDLAGRQVGVDVALGPRADLADDLDAVLVAQVVGAALGEHLVAGHDLDDTAGVAQVEERHPAVIAPPGHPARERDGLAGVVGTQGAGLVGAEHGRSFDRGGSGAPILRTGLRADRIGFARAARVRRPGGSGQQVAVDVDPAPGSAHEPAALVQRPGGVGGHELDLPARVALAAVVGAQHLQALPAGVGGDVELGGTGARVPRAGQVCRVADDVGGVPAPHELGRAGGLLLAGVQRAAAGGVVAAAAARARTGGGGRTPEGAHDVSPGGPGGRATGCRGGAAWPSRPLASAWAARTPMTALGLWSRPASTASCASSSGTQRTGMPSSSCSRVVPLVLGDGGEVAGQVDPQRLVHTPRRGEVVGEHVPAAGDEVGLLVQLARGGEPGGPPRRRRAARRAAPTRASARGGGTAGRARPGSSLVERDDGHRAGVADVLAGDLAGLTEVDALAARRPRPCRACDRAGCDDAALVERSSSGGPPAAGRPAASRGRVDARALDLDEARRRAAASIAAPTSPANSGWARCGRDLNSGWACVET